MVELGALFDAGLDETALSRAGRGPSPASPARATASAGAGGSRGVSAGHVASRSPRGRRPRPEPARLGLTFARRRGRGRRRRRECRSHHDAPPPPGCATSIGSCRRGAVVAAEATVTRCCLADNLAASRPACGDVSTANGLLVALIETLHRRFDRLLALPPIAWLDRAPGTQGLRRQPRPEPVFRHSCRRGTKRQRGHVLRRRGVRPLDLGRSLRPSPADGPHDYPSLYWLSRSLQEGMKGVFDLGGAIGIKFLAFREPLQAVRRT